MYGTIEGPVERSMNHQMDAGVKVADLIGMDAGIAGLWNDAEGPRLSDLVALSRVALNVEGLNGVASI